MSIRLLPTLHFDQHSTSSLLKSTFMLCSSTCIFHVLFSLHFFIWDFTSNPMPFSRHDHPLSPQHIPPNIVYHSQLFYAFILNQHQVINSFSTFQMYFTDCCQHGSLSYVKFPSHLLSSTMLHLNIELLALHSSCKQPHSALEKTSCNIATGHIF